MTTTPPPAEERFAYGLQDIVRYIAHELDVSGEAGRSAEELAAGYIHSNPADYSRVYRHYHKQGITTEDQAKLWMIRKGIAALMRRGHGRQSAQQIDQNSDGNYRLLMPFGDLRFERRKLQRQKPSERFPNLFEPSKLNPIVPGAESTNIRHTSAADLNDLRESMKHFGWLKEFPAIQTEKGVTIAGHRRLAVAKELGIKPVIMKLAISSDDAGKTEALRIAIVSNFAHRPMNKTDRNRIAEYLRLDQGWSLREIAKALHVNHTTVMRNQNTANGAKAPPTTATNPETQENQQVTNPDGMRNERWRNESAGSAATPEQLYADEMASLPDMTEEEWKLFDCTPEQAREAGRVTALVAELAKLAMEGTLSLAGCDDAALRVVYAALAWEIADRDERH